MEFPNFDPVIFQIWGPIGLNWYGLTYLMGFAGAWYMGKARSKQPGSPFTAEQVSDFLFYGFLGVVLGGRIGYVLFYHLDFFIEDPMYLFKIWDGGMSFHGGLLGVLVAFWYFSRKSKTTFFQSADFFVPMVPIGLATGRFGNFINGELWGRVTDLQSTPWAMHFPHDPAGVYRHPSMLYECFLEGIVLFIILYIYSKKPRPPMAVSGLFALGYGVFRFIIEYYREPDAHLKELAEFLSMGQILSLPMIIGGAIMIYLAYKKNDQVVKTA
ncbi:prolipoprotein diacylglyceryl transferase [Aliikangiella coralliicola]|uniref:Phosphatidylglycerol--prolipoprotein diacylglyceryl transferase n=1 Tax=Aliikangiella coralliicola TaxID=2592383 RepID=A0A545UI26_9GAMM|nr:prolipoprotein diacylglyceryl transferase [Aliikangiella coralliicola]TQV89121.1 prolipoprotein diacylglyceryl transferase [Aliikangiella coralliicola]